MYFVRIIIIDIKTLNVWRKRGTFSKLNNITHAHAKVHDTRVFKNDEIQRVVDVVLKNNEIKVIISTIFN